MEISNYNNQTNCNSQISENIQRTKTLNNQKFEENNKSLITNINNNNNKEEINSNSNLSLSLNLFATTSTMPNPNSSFFSFLSASKPLSKLNPNLICEKSIESAANNYPIQQQQQQIKEFSTSNNKNESINKSSESPSSPKMIPSSDSSSSKISSVAVSLFSYLKSDNNDSSDHLSNESHHQNNTSMQCGNLNGVSQQETTPSVNSSVLASTSYALFNKNFATFMKYSELKQNIDSTTNSACSTNININVKRNDEIAANNVEDDEKHSKTTNVKIEKAFFNKHFDCSDNEEVDDDDDDDEGDEDEYNDGNAKKLEISQINHNNKNEENLKKENKNFENEKTQSLDGLCSHNGTGCSSSLTFQEKFGLKRQTNAIQSNLCLYGTSCDNNKLNNNFHTHSHTNNNHLNHSHAVSHLDNLNNSTSTKLNDQIESNYNNEINKSPLVDNLPNEQTSNNNNNNHHHHHNNNNNNASNNHNVINNRFTKKISSLMGPINSLSLLGKSSVCSSSSSTCSSGSSSSSSSRAGSNDMPIINTNTSLISSSHHHNSFNLKDTYNSQQPCLNQHNGNGKNNYYSAHNSNNNHQYPLSEISHDFGLSNQTNSRQSQTLTTSSSGGNVIPKHSSPLVKSKSANNSTTNNSLFASASISSPTSFANTSTASFSTSKSSLSSSHYNIENELIKYTKTLKVNSQSYTESYKLGSHIRNGGFSEIYEGTQVKTNDKVIIKLIPKKKTKNWLMVHNKRYPAEILLHKMCNNIQGVVKMVEFFEQEQEWIIIMPKLINCVDMFDYLESKLRGRLNEQEACHFFTQLVKINIDLFNQGVVHRDIKSENLLVDLNTMKLVLIDFGASAICKNNNNNIKYNGSSVSSLQNYYTDFHGTRQYKPPEYITHKKYTALASTIWTLGILLYDMCNGQLPFETEQEIIEYNLQMKTHVTEEYKTLLLDCLQVDPALRPNLHQILEYPWCKTNLNSNLFNLASPTTSSPTTTSNASSFSSSSSSSSSSSTSSTTTNASATLAS